MKMPDWMRAALAARVARRQPVPVPERIFRSARDYHCSAQRCFELRANDGSGNFLPMQGMVLHAFAAELYLKGLIARETGKSPWGHDLEKLFGELAPAIQESVKARYVARNAGGELEDDLKEFALAFQTWRYSFELVGTHAIDQTGLAQLASALYETWAALAPELVTDAKMHARLTAQNQAGPTDTNGNFKMPPIG